MYNKPLVSAVIIFLNEERFLEEAIKSVLEQSYDNWELMLVDDDIYSIGSSNFDYRSFRYMYEVAVVGKKREVIDQLKDHITVSLNGSEDFDYKGWLTGVEGARGTYNSERASKFLVSTEVGRIDISSVVALENLRIQLKVGIPNDKAKYCLPESYKTSLVWTINARSLQNFLTLRTNKAALWEIRELAYAMFGKLPEEHKYLFEHCLYQNEEVKD